MAESKLRGSYVFMSVRGRGQRLNRRSLISSAATTGLGLAGSALVGCSSPFRGRQPAGGSQASGSSPQGAPQSGGAFNTYVNFNTTLDPHKTTGTAQQMVAGVYSRVFRFQTATDLAVGANHDLENDLGISAESPDAITWTVKLRPDARMQDIAPLNGRPVEAEDLKATFTRALDPAVSNPYRGALGMIDPAQIQTPARDTVVFKLSYPYAPFPKTLANPLYSFILPREVLSGAYDPAKKAIGSGPFILESYTPDVAYIYRKSPTWFEKGRPYVDGLRIAVLPDVAQQLAQFAGGNLDEITPSFSDLDRTKQNDPKAALITPLSGSASPIYFQLGDPASVFQDIRVRRAVSMAIDRDALSNAILGGQGVTGLSVPAYMGKWAIATADLDASTAQYYKYSPDAARKLFDAAGLISQPFKLGYAATGLFASPTYLKTAEAVNSMLNAVGIKSTLVGLDYNKDFVDDGKGLRNGFYPKDMIVLSATSPVTEADEILFSNYSSKSSSNNEHLSDPTLDGLIDKERTLLKEDERLAAVKNIEAYLADKMYAVFGVGAKYTYVLTKQRVQNYCYTTSWGKHTEIYAKLWLQA